MLLSLVSPGRLRNVSSILRNWKCSVRNQSGQGRATSRTRWTADEYYRLGELYQQGLPIEQIANMMDNRSICAIQQRIAICSRRQPSFGQGRAVSKTTPWTADEDHRLRELCHQGLPREQISGTMDKRSLSAVKKRCKDLKIALPPGQKKERRMAPRWSPQETALLFELKEQGLTHEQIASHFPKRSYYAVNNHLLNCESRTLGHQQQRQTYTRADLECIIHMRVKEAMSLAEIASELECSLYSITEVWRSRCVPLLSEETLRLVESYRVWTPKEEEHLLELHRKGTLSTRHAALRFPSKTMATVRAKCSHALLRFPRFSDKEESL